MLQTWSSTISNISLFYPVLCSKKYFWRMMKGILLNIFLMRLWQMEHIARLHIPIRKWSDFIPKAPKIGEKMTQVPCSDISGLRPKSIKNVPKRDRGQRMMLTYLVGRFAQSVEPNSIGFLRLLDTLCNQLFFLNLQTRFTDKKNPYLIHSIYSLKNS